MINSKNNKYKIAPDTLELIKGIIDEMTKIDLARQQNPSYSTQNEPERVKEMKKKCVHITCLDGKPQIRIHKHADGKYRCDACGRSLDTSFDKTAINKIMDAIEVIQGECFFGMLLGLKADPVRTLIAIKSTLPAVAQLLAELNEYIKRDQNESDTASNIGLEYRDTNITGLNFNLN